MKRHAAVLVTLALVLGGCLSSPDYDGEPEGHASDAYARIREKSVLENDLTALVGAECAVDVLKDLVKVEVTPGAKGGPDARLLRRMSERITEVTGMAPAKHLILAAGGRVLFSNGAVVTQ